MAVVKVNDFKILSHFNHSGKKVLEVTLPGSSGSKGNIGDVVVIADASGSMAGKGVRWVEHLAEHLFTLTKQVYWISFSGHVKNFGKVEAIPRGWFIGGQTDFFLPLREIQSYCLKDNSTIFFLTDGQENTNLAERQVLMAKGKLHHRNAKIEVVGVSRSSDTQVLFDISRWGEVEGSYVSLNLEEDLATVCASIEDNIGGEMMEVFGQNFRLTHNPQTVFVEFDLKQEISWNLSIKLKDVPEGKVDAIQRYTLQLIEAAIKSRDVPRMRQLAKSLEFSRSEDFAQISKMARQYPREERKAFLQTYTQFAQFVNQINHEVLQDRLSNEAYARLYTAASQARKPRINRLVSDRAVANLDVFKDQDEKMREVAASIKAELTKEEKDLLTEYLCLLTMDSADESITDDKNPDAMGIGVEFKSNPNAAVNPGMCSVLKISTSFFTCNNFLIQANESGLMVYSSQEKKIVDGARMGVNAVLPLYLSESHWKVASLLVRRMAGDPCASTNSMVVHAYLKLLGHATKVFLENRTEYNKKTLGLVRTTVRKLLEIPHYRAVFPTLEQFFKDPSQRNKAVIPDVISYTHFLAVTEEKMSNENTLRFAAYLTERKIRYTEHYDLQYPSTIDLTIQEWLKQRVIKLDPVEFARGDYKDLKLEVETIFPPLPPLPEWDLSPEDLKCKFPMVRMKLEGTPVSQTELGDYNGHRRYALWLMARQTLIHTGMEFEEKYVDYLSMSQEESRKAMEEVLRENYVRLARRYALGLINTCVSQGKEDAMKSLSPDLSLDVFTYMVSCYCRVGENIKRFAEAANNPEKMKIVMTGRDEDGTLLILNMNTCIHTHVYRRHGKGNRVRVTFSNVWVPNRKFLRKIHAGCDRSWLKMMLDHGSPVINYDPKMELYDNETPEDVR